MGFFWLMDNREKLINAFVQKPTTYSIEVRNNEMLPEELKEKKEIDFIIKPPSTYVLGLCATLMFEVPEEIIKMQDVDLKDALKYQETIAQIITVLSYEKMDYPDWCIDFILKNVAIVDLMKIMNETALKCNPSFFLSCFQIAEATNPMMLNDSTHSSS